MSRTTKVEAGWFNSFIRPVSTMYDAKNADEETKDVWILNFKVKSNCYYKK